ncbi:hypothetical protein phiK7B1_078 [Pseudomonas phage phiK7B1]|nr:hypothetical protein phiK7B1_078 [Pseudomonas phage phiK7B1]
MKSPYDMSGDGYMPPQRRVEFETFEEFEAAKEHIEALLLKNHQTMQKVQFLTDKLEAKEADLKEWQEALDREQDSFQEQHRKFESDQKDVLALQSRISLAIDRVNAANRDPIETINEILLMLELEASPEEIARLMREKREALDVKW